MTIEIKPEVKAAIDKRLIDILMSPPVAGPELQIERLKEYPQPPVEL